MSKMPDKTAYTGLHRLVGPDTHACWMVATPEVRRRLLGLAVAVLAPAVLPHDIQAQQTATGQVRLVIRADALPPGAFDASTQPILWMAPESARETERLAGLWARGDDAGALEAWKEVVRREIAADRLATTEQAEAAAGWIAKRATKAAPSPPGETANALVDPRAREILRVARATALASLEERLK